MENLPVGYQSWIAGRAGCSRGQVRLRLFKSKDTPDAAAIDAALAEVDAAVAAFADVRAAAAAAGLTAGDLVAEGMRFGLAEAFFSRAATLLPPDLATVRSAIAAAQEAK